jgi:S1/P1 Nuclease
LLLSVGVTETWAWGQEGHSIVAEIAQRRLSPVALQKMNELLVGEFPGLPASSRIGLASIASWADDYRASHDESRNWHFVDVSYGRDHYDPATDCQLDATYGDCIINAVGRFTAVLGDCSRPAGERRPALKFVAHFIGDLHQPLHAATRVNPDTAADDRSGNEIKVTFLGVPTNLHHVWDTDLIMHKVYDWGEYVRLLETQWLPGKDTEALQRGNTTQWAEEAHRAAQVVAYNFRPDHVLDEEYYADATATVDRQLALAGLRLARVLNDVLAPTTRCP